MSNEVSHIFAIAIVFGLIAAFLYLYCLYFSGHANLDNWNRWKNVFYVEAGPNEKPSAPTETEVGHVGKFTELIETGSISESENTDKRAQHCCSSANPSTSTIEQPGSPSSSEGQRSERNVERNLTAPYPLGDPSMPLPGLPGITFIEWQQPTPDNGDSSQSVYVHLSTTERRQFTRDLPPVYTDVVVEIPKHDTFPPQ